MKRILSGIAAVGLAVSCCLSASAIDQSYLDQITVDAMGKIYKIEVGTTVGEIKEEMASRGLTISSVITRDGILVSDAQEAGTYFSSYIYPTKVSRVYWAVTGDVDGNCEVNISDVQEVSRCIAAQNTGVSAGAYFDYPGFYAADANYDGKIDIMDVMEISRIIARHQNG